MKANALNDLGGKSETMIYDQTSDLELGGGAWLTLVYLSDDGKSICLIDKTGRSSCAVIPISEPVENGEQSVLRTLMKKSIVTCPYCKCVQIVIAGQIMYYDPVKKQLCGHNCSHH